MRISTLAPMAVAACLLASGCGAQAKSQATHIRRQSDVSWLRSYGLWSRRVRSDVGAAETLRASVLVDGSSAAAFAVAVNRLVSCAHRYRLNVGDPPDAAWRRPAALGLQACRGFTRAERLLLAASGRNGTEPLFAGQSALDRAGETMTHSNLLFEHTFVWNRSLPRIRGVSSASRIEPLFSRVGTPIAFKQVEIRCWSKTEWKKVLSEFHAFFPGSFDPAGFVDSSALTHRANIAPSTCRRLASLAYEHDYPPSGERQLDMAWAVQILSHEIQHLAAAGTEAQTECYGMQSLARVARGLGAPAEYARALAVRYWRDGYPTNDAVYHTPLCYDGGPLDANPRSRRWP